MPKPYSRSETQRHTGGRVFGMSTCDLRAPESGASQKALASGRIRFTAAAKHLRGRREDASEPGRDGNLRAEGTGGGVDDARALPSPGEHGGDGGGARLCRRSSATRPQGEERGREERRARGGLLRRATVCGEGISACYSARLGWAPGLQLRAYLRLMG
jgi:hypothetical protein